jgi:ribosomal protein S18 acetylase RimI-like enzyme
MLSGFVIKGPLYGQGDVCRAILDALPGWFELAEANAQYVVNAEVLPSLVARCEDRVVGLLMFKTHTPYAAEIVLLGVPPEYHRQGIGRALVAAAEAHLCAEGIEYLQVKTLGPSHPDPGYAGTRAFYERLGFRPLEEILTVWDANNPCLIYVKALPGRD